MSKTTQAMADEVAAESTLFRLRGNMTGALWLGGIAAKLRRLAAVEAERDQLREAVADKNAALDLMRQGAGQLRAEVEALRADSFESVIQGLAATLPDDGSSITIYVEHWSGSVTATDWDGNEMDEHEAETVLDRVRYAAKWLDEQQSKLKQGEAESQN